MKFKLLLIILMVFLLSSLVYAANDCVTFDETYIVDEASIYGTTNEGGRGWIKYTLNLTGLDIDYTDITGVIKLTLNINDIAVGQGIRIGMIQDEGTILNAGSAASVFAYEMVGNTTDLSIGGSGTGLKTINITNALRLMEDATVNFTTTFHNPTFEGFGATKIDPVAAGIYYIGDVPEADAQCRSSSHSSHPLLEVCYNLNPPDITNSSWNVTSSNIIEQSNSDDWNPNGEISVNVSTSLLSLEVTTNINTNMSCSLVDTDYVSMIALDSDYKAATTDTTAQATTLKPALSLGSQCVYCAFISSDATLNATSGCLNTTYLLSKFKITAFDTDTLGAVNTFSSNIDGAAYTTTNGTIVTDLFVNDSILYNTYVWATNYHNKTNTNVNVSTTLNAELTPYFIEPTITYANYFDYSGINYTRNLTYSVIYSCPSFSNSELIRNVNGLNTTETIECLNTTQILNSSFVHGSEGEYNISIILATSIAGQNRYIGNSTFTSDLFSPISVPTMTINFTGFGDAYANTFAICYDTVSPILTYDVNLNNTPLFFGNKTNNTLISNITLVTYGNYILRNNCSDFFSNSYKTTEQLFFAVKLFLIDEKDNTPFNVLNLTSVRAYYDDNSTLFDFKTANTSAVNFSSLANNKIRIELVYADGSVITRWIDISLFPNEEIKVCANKEGVTHYEQLILSASQKQAVLKSVFSDCIVAADYTRFAYQDSYILKAYTIETLYYLYTYSSGARLFLASVDGSIASFINLDVLELNLGSVNINILGDALTFRKSETLTDTIEIYYLNLANDNIDLTATIRNEDSNDIVFTTSDFDSYNNFTILFDYSTLIGINETSIFSITLDKTTEVGEDTLKRYFNIAGGTGALDARLAMAMAIILTLAGFLFTITRLSFSWFGIIMLIASIAVLSFALTTWYTKWFMAIDFIVLVFTFIILTKKNYSAVS